MSALWKQLGVVTAGMFLMVAFQAHAADGKAGAELYNKTCMACHKDKPAKMMGKPVADLVKSISSYQTMACPTGGAEKMQNAVKGLDAMQIENVATYLNALK